MSSQLSTKACHKYEVLVVVNYSKAKIEDMNKIVLDAIAYLVLTC